MTYTELWKQYWGCKTAPDREAVLTALDEPTRTAWSIVKLLDARKGFDHWWCDAGHENRNDIFAKMVALISSNVEADAREGAR